MAYKQGVGCQSIVYIGKQSGVGVPQTTMAAALDIISITPKPRIGLSADPSIYNGSSEQKVSALSIGWGGTLKVRGNLQGAGLALLLEAVLGSQSGAPTHTIVEAVSAPWFTMYYSRGDVDTGQFERLTDVKFTGFTFNISAAGGAEGYGTFDFDFLAAGYSNGLALTSPPALPVSDPMLYTLIDPTTLCDGVNTGLATLAWRPTRLAISYKIPFEADLPYFTTQAMDAPCRNGLAVCTWDWTERLIDLSLVNAAKAGTMNTGGALKCKLVSGSYNLTFTSTEARCADYDGNINGYGILDQQVQWRAQKNATDAGSLKVVHISTV